MKTRHDDLDIEMSLQDIRSMNSLIVIVLKGISKKKSSENVALQHVDRRFQQAFVLV